MTRFLKYLIPAVLLVAAVTAVVVSAQALAGQDETPAAESPAAAAAVIPDEIHYQGFLLDDVGDPVDGLVDMQFDLFKDELGGISLWSETYNDVDVDQGYFAVALGPLTTADLTLPAGATTLYVQVSILPAGGGSVALPRQPLASAPYAFLSMEAAAAPWDGLTGVPAGFADGIDDVEFANVVTVAKSGAMFTSIQAAIDSITDADNENRYMVWIAPGRYAEQVITKPYVHLVGSGKWLTWIESDAANDDIYPPLEGTLNLTNDVIVRELTVNNYGAGYRNVAILGLNGTTATLVNVSAVTGNTGDIHYGIFVDGPDSDVNLHHVESFAYNPGFISVALEVANGAQAWVQDGRFGAYNGEIAAGIVAAGTVGEEPNSRLELFEVDVEAADTNNLAMGLVLNDGAEANVRGGQFEARNAMTETIGIAVNEGAAMEAIGVAAYGYDSPLYNKGLRATGSWVLLQGGIVSAWGGQESIGIVASGAATLEASNARANAEAGIERNDGVRVESGAVAQFNSGAYFGEGGGDNRGMAVYDEGSVLDVQNAEVQGDTDSELQAGFGVTNEAGAVAFIALSEVYGVSESVLADGATTTIQLTKLAGGPVGGGGALCLGITYSGAFYADSCP